MNVKHELPLENTAVTVGKPVPTMSSLEMVDYINAVAESIGKSADIRDLDGCLELIEGFRKSVSERYTPICRVIYCHIISLIAKQISDAECVDCEGGVYLIEFDDGFVKIGMTATSFSKRLKTIAHQTPSNIKRYEFIPCDKPSKVESRLHRHFASVRGNGEFFKVNFDDCYFYARQWALGQTTATERKQAKKKPGREVAPPGLF